MTAPDRSPSAPEPSTAEVLAELRESLLDAVAQHFDFGHDTERHLSKRFQALVEAAQQRLADKGQGGGSDGFRLDEWNALPNVCLFAGCDNAVIDERGPIWLRGGSMRKACTEHWEPIMRVLGEQATWERDASRAAPGRPENEGQADGQN